MDILQAVETVEGQAELIVAERAHGRADLPLFSGIIQLAEFGALPNQSFAKAAEFCKEHSIAVVEQVHVPQ